MATNRAANRDQKVSRDDRGSYTLEAAVILPAFLTVMLLLINFINITMVYIAMDHAVGETARQIAALAYPLKYLQSGGQADFQPAGLSAVTRDLPGIAGDLLKETGAENLTGQVARELALRMIRGYLPDHINPAGVEITRLKIYQPNQAADDSAEVNGILLADEDIAVVVGYRVRLAAPLLPLREVAISSVAVERAWVAD